MLEGVLPFDNKNLCALFKIIQMGRFKFNKTITIEGKDLINRMLQPDTLKRLTIEEIKSHPWFNKDIDSYLFDYDFIYCKINTKAIDKEIFQKLFSLGFNINPKDEGRLMKAIQKKDNLDFCAAYQELNHIKMLSKIQIKQQV